MEPDQKDRRYLLKLSLGALGVVFGDIGTSPLYAMRECFHGSHAVDANPVNVLGVLSLIIWALVLVVSFKYLIYVLAADNRGEGGVLALLALLLPHAKLSNSQRRYFVLCLALCGASLLYGDGVITPAISVLSAIEGLNIATPFFEPYVMPLAIVVLVGLFLIQKHGTGSLGTFFGPIILLWFLIQGVLGIRGILTYPGVLAAFSPHYAVQFLALNGPHGFAVLGAVFLVCTGAEAMYADMGHFGRLPIQIAWFAVVLPALLLNYLGQGALLLSHPTGVTNPFYQLAPSWAIIPLVILAMFATTIASQALISGAFSLTRQAVQLGYLPRVTISHTSSKEIGQIYVPLVNNVLLVLVIAVVLEFHSSANLAAAYGIAVSLTMFLTTVLMFFASLYLWEWKLPYVMSLTFALLLIDLHFVGANLLKLWDGGWVPLVMAAVCFTVMTTWWRGRNILANILQENATPLNDFLDQIEKQGIHRVPGVAIYMSRDIDRAPTALIHNLAHNKIVHETVIFLRVLTSDKPYVTRERRISLKHLRNGFYRLSLRYGFMQDPNVPRALNRCAEHGLAFDMSQVTFFLGRETVIASTHPGMALWREHLFSFITKIAARPSTFFQIPPEQVVEIGYQVEI